MRDVVMNDLIELYQRFRNLYRTTPLQNVSEDYIQIETKAFVETFSDYKVEKFTNYSYELTATYNGITFKAIAYDFEVEKYEIQI